MYIYTYMYIYMYIHVLVKSAKYILYNCLCEREKASVCVCVCERTGVCLRLCVWFTVRTQAKHGIALTKTICSHSFKVAYTSYTSSLRPHRTQVKHGIALTKTKQGQWRSLYYGSSKALLKLYQGKAGAKTLRLNTALVVP